MWYKLQKIYIGQQQVRARGWQPWANTVAYYPLTSNADDDSWNGYNATNYGATFSETNWAYFGAVRNRLELPNMTVGNVFTISLWAKVTSNLSWDQEFNFYYDRSYYNRNLLFRYSASWTDVYTGNNAYNQDSWTASTSPWTWWNNIILVKNWTSLNVYKNWTSIWTHTGYDVSIPWWSNTVCVWGTVSAWSSGYKEWYIKDYIIENVARTAQEVADYYNLTKWNYWIS